MKKVILATHNLNKVKEIEPLLLDLKLKVSSLKEFPDFKPVSEDGRTIEENARKKASEAARGLGMWVLSDDTGLEVDALNGQPGVLSARFAGEGSSYADNNRKLLWLLRGLGLEQRTALFRCVVSLASPQGKVWSEEGILRGLILEEFRGERGFGYDPLFFIPSLGKTLAELALEEKNRISHRAQAIHKAKAHILRELLEASP